MKLTTLTDEENRRAKVIEYITDHQGCKIQDVVRGVESYVSRVTVFNILDSLEKVGAIRRQKEKPNSRDHKLFVDSNNPLISLPKEFDEFKRYYYPLLERVKKEYKKQDIRLLGRLGFIFVEFMRIYDSRALLVWPKQIRDTESLRNLYMLLFSEVLEILGEIRKVFQFLLSGEGAPTEEGIFANIGVGLLGWVPIAISELKEQFARTNMRSEARRVLEYVSAMSEKEYDSYVKKIEEQFGNLIKITGNREPKVHMHGRVTFT
jgi:hypothetical protein